MSDAPDDSQNVAEGVDFGDLDARLEAHGFPIDHDELVSTFGDFELELTSADDMTLRDALEPLQGGDTYEDAAEVHQAILNLLPDDAVGREGYSDRGGDTPTETDDAERVDDAAGDRDESF